MNMTISSINFGARLPKKSPVKVKKEQMPDFFRDNELFDSRKDRVNYDYFRYDNEEFPSGMEDSFKRFNNNMLTDMPFDRPYNHVVNHPFTEDGKTDFTDLYEHIM